MSSTFSPSFSPVTSSDPWPTVWDKMKYTGWEHLNPIGSGRFKNLQAVGAGTYVLPGGKLEKEGGVKGEDWLECESELKVSERAKCKMNLYLFTNILF